MKSYKTPNKVAIVHDIIFTFGGAEVVLDQICNLFPRAELFTLAISPEAQKAIKLKFPFITLHTSLLHFVPFLFQTGKFLSLAKLFSWIYWETLDLQRFSLIISSSHSFGAKAVKRPAGALHVSYIHTPPKYLYDEFSEWAIVKKRQFSILTRPILNFLRRIDKRGASRPDVLIANSKAVQKRIQRYYNRPSVVIYPPVAMPKRLPQTQKKYYLCLSRLSKQKGVHLAVQTCTKHQLPLIVVGKGTEEKSMRQIAGRTVTFYGTCTENEKSALYASAIALIYPAIDEDFGITPVESMSYGIPVVAYNSAGTKETVINGKTGVLFDEYTTDGLKRALVKLGNLNINSNDCLRQARIFSKKKFRQQLLHVINEQKSL